VCLTGTVSDWLEVFSGVPQGSVMGPLLSVMYINDLDHGITNWILKFADDTKIFGRISNQEDTVRLQEDLNRFIEWTEERQMMFNASKCKVMHLGRKEYNNMEYYMSGQCLLTITEEDLGIVISVDVKPSQQCIQAFSKASRILFMITTLCERQLCCKKIQRRYTRMVP